MLGLGSEKSPKNGDVRKLAHVYCSGACSNWFRFYKAKQEGSSALECKSGHVNPNSFNVGVHRGVCLVT